jgi:hypothetical protein
LWFATAVGLGALLAATAGVERAAAGGNAAELRRRLIAEAHELAAACRRRFGEAYRTFIDPDRHVVYASALDGRSTAHARDLVGRHLDAHRLGLFPLPLRWNITVVLPTVADYRKNEAATETGATGHYHAATRTLTSISLSRILLHELTHALHHHDQVLVGQEHAIWVSEGLATLYESAEIEKGRLVPQVGPNLLEVQEAVGKGQDYPLAELCRMDRAAFRKQNESTYPQVQYLMFYLHEKGKLRDFYNTYKLTYASDPTGAEALAKTLGGPIERAQEAWRGWVRKQPPPWRPGYTTKANLGIRMGRTTEGVRVDGLPRGSAARKVGRLRVGDVITAVGGRPTPTPRALAEAVQAHRPGRTVAIEILRDGRPTIINHVLGAVRP